MLQGRFETANHLIENHGQMLDFVSSVGNWKPSPEIGGGYSLGGIDDPAHGFQCLTHQHSAARHNNKEEYRHPKTKHE